MTTWFTADLHFGHLAQVIRRGFGGDDDAIARHDEELVARWNARVEDRDEVWVLGDLTLRGVERAASPVTQLRGRIHLQPGNHDRPAVLAFCHDIGWTIEPPLRTKHEYDEEAQGSRLLVLCHYPLLTWDKAHYGSWALHGHSHGNLNGPLTTRLDVGVDCWQLAPVSWEEVCATLRERSYGAVDHHARRATGESGK